MGAEAVAKIEIEMQELLPLMHLQAPLPCAEIISISRRDDNDGTQRSSPSPPSSASSGTGWGILQGRWGSKPSRKQKKQEQPILLPGADPFSFTAAAAAPSIIS